jgi:hypothetical protein
MESSSSPTRQNLSPSNHAGIYGSCDFYLKSGYSRGIEWKEKLKLSILMLKIYREGVKFVAFYGLSAKYVEKGILQNKLNLFYG